MASKSKPFLVFMQKNSFFIDFNKGDRFCLYEIKKIFTVSGKTCRFKPSFVKRNISKIKKNWRVSFFIGFLIIFLKTV